MNEPAHQKALREFQQAGKDYKRYVLAELRLALRRAKLLVDEIEHIGKTLSADMIDCDTALYWLADAKALEFLRPVPPDILKDNVEAQAKAREVFASAPDGDSSLPEDNLVSTPDRD